MGSTETTLLLARQESFLGIHSESGQSLVEFLLMFPFLIGVSLVLFKIAMAIQVAIVDQKYARAQALFIPMNSPYFPTVDDVQGRLIPNGDNQLVVGVSETEFSTDPNVVENKQPEATAIKITRTGQTDQGNTTAQTEGDSVRKRGSIRVRNTVSLCSQTHFLEAGDGVFVPVVASNMLETYGEQMRGNICRRGL